MRYDATRKQQTRERILKAAARQLRERGPQGIALAGVMAEAGLTHGGFYAHFASREAFLDAVVEQMFRDSPAGMLTDPTGATPREILAAFIDYYLSPGHRDTRTGGCPLPFLAGDAPRLGPGLHATLSRGVAGITRLVARLMEQAGHPRPQDEAQSCISEIIGAVVLARAETDPARSDLILARSRSSVRRRIGLEDT